MKNRTNNFCNGCKYLYITYDKFKPWGCSNFGFKSRNLPSHVVFATTGMKCVFYKKDTLLNLRKNIKAVENSMSAELDTIEESIKIALDAADAATDITSEYNTVKENIKS